jgi:hypothetical protein
MQFQNNWKRERSACNTYSKPLHYFSYCHDAPAPGRDISKSAFILLGMMFAVDLRLVNLTA